MPTYRDSDLTSKPEKRVAARQRRNRQALIEAAHVVMSRKGVEATTMLDITEHADIGAGTIYNYFTSKQDLTLAVLEEIMRKLAGAIERVTNTFTDSAQAYAFGIRTLIETAIQDGTWRHFLPHGELMSDAMFRVIGPFAMRDLALANNAGRFRIRDISLLWQLACRSIVGYSYLVVNGRLNAESIEETVVLLLTMTGLSLEDARELAARPVPKLTT